ncbi:NADH-quinone oxidoreductase subunit L, partial [Streptomyces cyaneofuscatus]
MTTTTLAALVPLLPFLGAVAGLALGRTAPGFVRPLAILPTLTAAVLAVLVAVRQGGGRARAAPAPRTPPRARPRAQARPRDGGAGPVS